MYTTCTLYKVSFCSYGSSYNEIKVNKLNQHHKSLSKSKKHLKLRDTICANECCYLRLTPRRSSVIRTSRALHFRQLRLLSHIVKQINQDIAISNNHWYIQYHVECKAPTTAKAVGSNSLSSSVELQKPWQSAWPPQQYTKTRPHPDLKEG